MPTRSPSTALSRAPAPSRPTPAPSASTSSPSTTMPVRPQARHARVPSASPPMHPQCPCAQAAVPAFLQRRPPRALGARTHALNTATPSTRPHLRTLDAHAHPHPARNRAPMTCGARAPLTTAPTCP
ncbi:hypothetical protein OF83DRAFT_1175598 [Amylostereum chailletii]|nr:hypothetical protein OF83DRAFT_1175598 [Amylostereum chailletii]